MALNIFHFLLLDGTRSAKAALSKSDYHRCRKHIFIALRFLHYGIELAECKQIKDISCVNHLWFDQLCSDQGESWDEYMQRYGPLLAHLKSKFKAAAPRLPRYGGFREPAEARYATWGKTRASSAPQNVTLRTLRVTPIVDMEEKGVRIC